ncbi:hypothetical protein SARC_07485 [Sphaeroforma arctica JP610]|uniref:Uncharacterized protein n=1 Tax=Sphaeroforma arctica JP610 TaxID=667725 RepID=A0A0L0FUC1_9EUKA|nr:hypothetical protein SARC_07485 [Sphaeroforma arctica JP610]KNC80146.1 hypothetical protein SARC_07485 [Sphaeroforma arctica JP610]|eukprot:XP_014154048.1 hypothetical protein SARC_07485 [Sphaeroforma arctica JP610]
MHTHTIALSSNQIKHKHNPTLSVRLLEIARARSALEIEIAEVFEAIKDYNSQRLALEMCCDTLLMTAKVHAQQLKNTTYVSESEDDADIEGLLPVHTQRLPQAHARTHAHTHRAKKNTHKTVIPARASVRPDAKRSSVLAEARDKGADAKHGTDGAGDSENAREEVILSPNQKQDKGTANANRKQDKAAAPNKNTRKAKRKNEAATASAVTTTSQAVADKATNDTSTGECGAELESPTSDRDPTDHDTQPAKALGKTRAGASSAQDTTEHTDSTSTAAQEAPGVGVGAGGVGHADAPVENSAAPVTYRDNAETILVDTSNRHNPNHTDNNTQKGSQHTTQNMQKQSQRPTKASGDGMRMGGGGSSIASAGADVDVSGDNWITHRARSKDKRNGVKKRPKGTDKGTAPSGTAATTISACRQARGVSVGVDGPERVASETSQTEEAPTVSGPTAYRNFVNMEKHLRDNIARTANTAGQRKMRCHKKGGSRAHSRNGSWIAGADASFDGVLAHESVSVGMSLSRHRQAQAAPVKVFNPAMYSIPRRKDSASDLDVSRNNRSALPFFASSAETSLNMSQPLQELGQDNGSFLNGIARPKKKRKLGGGGGSFLL